MNRRMVLYIVGKAVMIEGGLMLLPLITALIYRETAAVSIAASVGIALVGGFLLTKIFRPGFKVIYAKEGFVTVAFSFRNNCASGLPTILLLLIITTSFPSIGIS